MGDNEKEFDIGKIRGSIGERVKTLLSPDRCEGLTNVDIYNKIYGNTGTGEPSKKNKISALRRGEVSTDMEELIRIAHAMDVSLDWLMLGKGDPPPELQGNLTPKTTSSDETTPADTARGFLTSLMCLSLARYVHDFKIDYSCENYYHHKINISFKFEPFESAEPYYDCDDDCYYPDYYQCDTVSYLTLGFRCLSNPKYHLLDLPNDDKAYFDVKTGKYNEILDFIPSDKELSDYKRKCTCCAGFGYIPDNFLPLKKGSILYIPKSYDSKKD